MYAINKHCYTNVHLIKIIDQIMMSTIHVYNVQSAHVQASICVDKCYVMYCGAIAFNTGHNAALYSRVTA